MGRGWGGYAAVTSTEEDGVQTPDYAGVPGVAECRLDAATLARLPANETPAPWTGEFTAVVWWARAGRAATRAAAAGGSSGPRALTVAGGFAAYDHTPVGRYHEVFGAIGVRHGAGVAGTVPFMAVDSRASLVAGRGNWSLPKCPAAFTGDPGQGLLTARGDGWTVRAEPRPFGPWSPLPVAGRLVQRWPDGVHRVAVLRGRARARAAIVEVQVESAGQLATWLRPGRHLGAVLSQTSFTLSESR
jgi:hypothetical protein